MKTKRFGKLRRGDEINAGDSLIMARDTAAQDIAAQQKIDSLLGALRPLVEVRADAFNAGEQGGWREADLYETAIKQMIAVWLAEAPEFREAHLEFGGGFNGSESVYLTAYVFDNPEDLNILAEAENVRLAFHPAKR